jgi:hypothetical protein
LKNFQDFNMTQHGGARNGAGRKKGGANALNDQARKVALAAGESPLEFLLNAMRDTGRDVHTRLDAAKAAAPYVHAKLQNVDMTAKIEKDVTALSDAELLSIAAASSANSSEETEYSGLSH